MTEQKKVYTTDDNIRAIMFDMKRMVVEIEKISAFAMEISSILRGKKIEEEFELPL